MLFQGMSILQPDPRECAADRDNRTVGDLGIWPISLPRRTTGNAQKTRKAPPSDQVEAADASTLFHRRGFLSRLGFGRLLPAQSFRQLGFGVLFPAQGFGRFALGTDQCDLKNRHPFRGLGQVPLKNRLAHFELSCGSTCLRLGVLLSAQGFGCVHTRSLQVAFKRRLAQFELVYGSLRLGLDHFSAGVGCSRLGDRLG